MSCNGCRVLRKGCSETCVLRSCLQWIDSAEAQGHATLFLAKFFGRSDLLSFVSSVPDHQRPALFQSLLFEACGRTVNPVNGAVGLLSSGNWHMCQAAVQTVLAGGALRPMQGILALQSTPPPLTTRLVESSGAVPNRYYPPSVYDVVPKQDHYNQGLMSASAAAPTVRGGSGAATERLRRDHTISLSSEESVTTTSFGIGDRKERKLLNLFV